MSEHEIALKVMELVKPIVTERDKLQAENRRLKEELEVAGDSVQGLMKVVDHACKCGGKCNDK